MGNDERLKSDQTKEIYKRKGNENPQRKSESETEIIKRK